MASKFATSHRAGWLFAGPAFGLMVLFVLVPFLFAIAFSFTNQRLFSPNPTQFVGLSNYSQLLGLSVLTLDPVTDAAGAVQMKDGAPEYPALRSYTRKNPEYPHLDGKREWFSIDRANGARSYVLASDVVFMKALVNTFLFVLIVAPLQGGLALGLALLINQKLRGINAFRTIYFMPVVVSIVVVSMLWKIIYDGNSGLLNNLLPPSVLAHSSPWIGWATPTPHWVQSSPCRSGKRWVFTW